MSVPTPPAGHPWAVASINTTALWALPLAVAFPLLGVVLAHVARAEIRRTGELGAGVAKAALFLGYPTMALWTVFWLNLLLAVLPVA